MSDKFLNMIRMQANLATSGFKYSSVGIITGVDEGNYLVTVQLLESTDTDPAVQTGWIPFLSPWVGNGWGMFVPPSQGNLCEVHYQEGSIQNAYACLCSPQTTANQSPAKSGEFWLVHQSGSYFKLTNDGKVSLNGNIEIDISSPKININVTNDCTLTANTVTVDSPSITLGNGTLEPLINALAESIYNTHTHSDPQGGITGPPNNLITNSCITQNLKAS